MGFDWKLYCLEWLTVLAAFGLVWPLVGILLDILIYGAERDIGPTGERIK